MIPEAAVEAAAEVIFEGEANGPGWKLDASESQKREIRALARAALDAAAPHMTGPTP